MPLLDAFTYFEQAVQWAGADGSTPVWSLIWVVLFASGIGAPLPEDIPLTLTGFLTFQSGFFGSHPNHMTFILGDFLYAFLYVTSAILIGDACCWWLGKKFGLPIRERVKLFKRLLTDKRLEKVQGWFQRFGGGTVFLGRQVAGVRFVTFFTAGTVRMPLLRFLFWDFLGALVSVPVWLTLGAIGSNYQDELKNWIANTSVGFLAAVVIGVVALIVYVRHRRKPKEADAALANISVTGVTSAAIAGSVTISETVTGDTKAGAR
ncbi:MAG: DedA family protein [Planctomycetes bacterium]|nr:DedA family protein [Planctomycetota bacterium]NUQ33426.1 DedA family protein [Planctomycetaceae bacterium]